MNGQPVIIQRNGTSNAPENMLDVFVPEPAPIGWEPDDFSMAVYDRTLRLIEPHRFKRGEKVRLRAVGYIEPSPVIVTFLRYDEDKPDRDLAVVNIPTKIFAKPVGGFIISAIGGDVYVNVADLEPISA